MDDCLKMAKGDRLRSSPVYAHTLRRYEECFCAEVSKYFLRLEIELTGSPFGAFGNKHNRIIPVELVLVKINIKRLGSFPNKTKSIIPIIPTPSVAVVEALVQLFRPQYQVEAL